jgi:hypothetical protein
MQDEQPQPEVSAHIDELALGFEALGMGDIAARLRALSAAPEPPSPAPRLGHLLEQQLRSILDQTEQP